MENIAITFPGQGSQYINMCNKKFLNSSSEIKNLFNIAEEISNIPIRKLILEGTLEELSLTINLQPILTALNLSYLLYLNKIKIKPNIVAGHSLGEYSALVACKSITINECLKLVSLRGRLMHEDSCKKSGTMVAIIGLEYKKIKHLCNTTNTVQIANFNTEQQTIITGETEEVLYISNLAKEYKAKIIKLNVSGAWHSSLMSNAKKKLEELIKKIDFAEPSCLYIPNTTGKIVSDPLIIKNELCKQLTSSVKWLQTIQTLYKNNINVFIECGPNNILTNITKKILINKNIKIHNFENYIKLNKKNIIL